MGIIEEALDKAKRRLGSEKSAPSEGEATGPGEISDAVTRDRTQPEILVPTEFVGSKEPKAPVPSAPTPMQTRSEQGNGVLPFVEGGFDPTFVSSNETASLIIEQYRAIRTNILASPEHRRPFVFVLTSSARKEGKTVSTINLALCLAELGDYRVLCVDADTRGPSMANVLEIDPSPGILSVITGQTDFDSVIQSTPVKNLDVISCPTVTHVNPTPAFSSQEARNLIEQMRLRYDYVLIDAPPIIDFTDAGLLGAITDGAYLVVQLYRTPRQVVKRAASLLRSAQSRVLGCFLTNLQMFVPKYLYRYDYELYRYQYQ